VADDVGLLESGEKVADRSPIELAWRDLLNGRWYSTLASLRRTEILGCGRDSSWNGDSGWERL